MPAFFVASLGCFHRSPQRRDNPNQSEVTVAKIGRGLYTNDDEGRIFVDPDVKRYEREDGGEVIVVESADDASSTDESDTEE